MLDLTGICPIAPYAIGGTFLSELPRGLVPHQRVLFAVDSGGGQATQLGNVLRAETAKASG